MHNSIKTNVEKISLPIRVGLYECNQGIFQEIALLGLWRAKFFERAAFYGGSSLRILYQLDRFSEDLDFTLLKRMRVLI